MTTPKPANGTLQADPPNPPPSTSLTAPDRWELLVNNDLFADVVFSVGTEGTPMYGHKAVLTVASDVFRAQFTGSFRESRENGPEHEIPVIDIEPPVFKEILRYAYCDKVSITADNVLHLLYAGEKYLLTELVKKCTQFMEKHLSEENVLRIFAQNRSYELEAINGKCLDIICANPIRMFGDEHFLTLDSKSLGMIAECKRMNCQLTHLLGGIENWLKINEHDADHGNKILSEVQKRTQLDHKCKIIHNFSSGLYQEDFHCEIIISTSDSCFNIHGIGVPIKKKASSVEGQTVRVDVSIVRALKQRYVDFSKPDFFKSITRPVDEGMHVAEILFERQTIDNQHWLHVQIRSDNTDWSPFTFDEFKSDQPEVDLEIDDQTYNGICVSHVLYTEG